jgi:hypothetical protein
MGYTAAQVEEIAGKLRALPTIEPPPKDLTKSDAIKMLTKEIKSLQKRGYSLEQIASSLKGEGLDISTPTLKSYLQRTKTDRAKAKSNTEAGKKTASPTSNGSSKVLSDSPKSEESVAHKTAQSPNTFTPRPDSVDL